MAPPLGIYGWTPGHGGVFYHRIAEPIRVLAEAGNVAFHGKQLDDRILSTVDTLLVHNPNTHGDLEALRIVEKAGDHLIVIDIDDAMWAPDFQPFADYYTPEILGLVYEAVGLAHVVTCTSEPIADHLVRYNPNVQVVPNSVPAWLLEHTMTARDRPTIGYQGSSSHLPDWHRSTRRAFQLFLKTHPGWGVQWMGTDPGPIRDRIGFRCVPWRNPGQDYYRAISMDVGIGPLRPTRFNLAKSNLRAVEYAALGIVAVLPDLPIYTDWVEDGVTGILYPNERGAFHDAMCRAAALDPEQRAAMGAAARRRAQQWTTEATISKWVKAWNSQ